MDVGEGALGDSDGQRWQSDVAMSLGSLARETRLTPGSDVPGEVGPDVAGRNKAAGSPNARMTQVMEVMKKGKTESSGVKRAKKCRRSCCRGENDLE